MFGFLNSIFLVSINIKSWLFIKKGNDPKCCAQKPQNENPEKGGGVVPINVYLKQVSN